MTPERSVHAARNGTGDGGRALRHVHPDDLRYRRRRAGGARRRELGAVSLDQHRVGPRRHDGRVCVGRNFRRASQSRRHAGAGGAARVSVGQGAALCDRAMRRRIRGRRGRVCDVSRGAERLR